MSFQARPHESRVFPPGDEGIEVPSGRLPRVETPVALSPEEKVLRAQIPPNRDTSLRLPKVDEQPYANEKLAGADS
jgi:hypothetical protein